MKAYLINLKSAPQRREYASANIAAAGFEQVLVEGIVGRELPLPHPDYDATAYRLRHGKRTNPGELGCYFSHLKALRLFLDSGDTHGLILEDDVAFAPDAPRVIGLALAHANRWDMLRLSALHRPLRITLLRLDATHSLCMDLTRQTGAGGYIVNRKAAEALLRGLLPMRLPYDHAFDFEWLMGFRSLSLHPVVIDQDGRHAVHASQIGASTASGRFKYPALTRYWTVFPYRSWTETLRFITRLAGVVAFKCARR